MEKSDLLRDVGGGIMVPIGFRFRPNNEELIVHYLMRKIYSLPLPASVIPERDVFQTNPWDFPGELNEKKYFFSRIRNENENVKNNNNNNRVEAGCGYWKSLGNGKQHKQIVVNNQLVGIKKTMVFYHYQGKRSHGIKTPWVMHQLCLVHCPTQDCIMQVGEWVVCRIFQKKRRAKKNGNKRRECIGNVDSCSIIVNDDDDVYLGSPQLGSTCSSGITEIALTESSIDQEITSDYCYNNVV